MPLAVFFGFLGAQIADKGKQIAWAAAKYSAWSVFTIASLAALVASFIALLNGIKVSVPSTAIQVWGWFMPDNAFECLTAIVSAKFLRAIYDFKVRMATIKLESVR